MRERIAVFLCELLFFYRSPLIEDGTKHSLKRICELFIINC